MQKMSKPEWLEIKGFIGKSLFRYEGMNNGRYCKDFSLDLINCSLRSNNEYRSSVEYFFIQFIYGCSSSSNKYKLIIQYRLFIDYQYILL